MGLLNDVIFLERLLRSFTARVQWMYLPPTALLHISDSS